VLFRRIDGADEPRVQICLIATRRKTRWQLPKGHISAGETEAEAARREIREETGCDGEIEGDLGEIVFWFFVGSGGSRRRIKKNVRFFLARYRAGQTADHDAEVDDAAWLDADHALRQLTFDSERQILEKALVLIRESGSASAPAPTS